MQSILEALSQAGVDPNDALLIGQLKHIPAGVREHWAGENVSVFKPAVTEMRIMDRHSGGALLTFECHGEDLANEEAFWAQMQVPAPVVAADAIKLAQSLVEFHRDLTGEIGRTHEVIENNPEEISKIKAARADLKIDLMHLVNFVAKDDALFDAIFESSIGGSAGTQKSEIQYERDSLLAKFVKTPCERDLYDKLRKEYAHGEYLGGIVFQDYYGWFRKSEAKFGTEGGFPQETIDVVRQAMTAWLSIGDPPTDEWMNSKEKLFIRNFQVHPQHRDAVASFLRGTLQELLEENNQNTPRGVKP